MRECSALISRKYLCQQLLIFHFTFDAKRIVLLLLSIASMYSLLHGILREQILTLSFHLFVQKKNATMKFIVATCFSLDTCYTVEQNYMAAELPRKVQVYSAIFLWFEFIQFLLHIICQFMFLLPPPKSLLSIDPLWCHWSLVDVEIASSCYAVLSSVNILSFPPNWCLSSICTVPRFGHG